MDAFSRRPTNCHWALIGAFALISCSHEGVGTGVLEKPAASAGSEKPEGIVEFSWRSGADPSDGRIEAVTSDGRKFDGTFVQPRGHAWVDSYDPYWDAWTNVGWGVPSPWYVGPQDAFITTYSGKALAHLMAPDGTRMRCVFILRDPSSGMTGGGQGDCQMSTQERVFGARLAKG
jgi:hypothetical protein